MANLLASGERRSKVIGSSDLRDSSRYPPRTPSAAIGHVHRTVNVRSERALTARLAVLRAVVPTVDSTQGIGVPLAGPTAIPSGMGELTFYRGRFKE
jgi:hypothetical protein